MPEIRWILLGLGVLLLAAIWVLGNRRPRQARGTPELRTAEVDHITTMSIAGTAGDTDFVEPREFSSSGVTREAAIRPFEPLRIHPTAHDDTEHALNIPIMVEPAVDQHVAAAVVHEPADEHGETHAATHSQTMVDPHGETHATTHSETHTDVHRTTHAATHTTSRTDISGRFSSLKAAPSKPVELQKIVTVRVCAGAGLPWDGAQLATALAATDLVHGRYGVFHRRHADGRTVFCVASLVEPGSFDPVRMHEQQFPGITVFAVLPGPLDPQRAFEDLMAAARHLSEQLSGMMQDDSGAPLSPQRVGVMRDEVIQFRNALPENSPG